MWCHFFWPIPCWLSWKWVDNEGAQSRRGCSSMPSMCCLGWSLPGDQEPGYASMSYYPSAKEADCSVAPQTWVTHLCSYHHPPRGSTSNLLQNPICVHHHEDIARADIGSSHHQRAWPRKVLWHNRGTAKNSQSSAQYGVIVAVTASLTQR